MNEKEKESFGELMRTLGFMTFIGIGLIAIVVLLPADIIRIVNTAFPGIQLSSDSTTRLFVACWVLLVFFLIRELFTWYWKINRIVALLEKIEKNTRPNSSDT